jgi:uncharacterized repeat protein (TIGR02543 family)
MYRVSVTNPYRKKKGDNMKKWKKWLACAVAASMFAPTFTNVGSIVYAEDVPTQVEDTPTQVEDVPEAETKTAGSVTEGVKVLLRQNGDKVKTYFTLTGDEAWMDAIQTVTLMEDHTACTGSCTTREGNTFTKEKYGEEGDWWISKGSTNYLYFWRTNDEPIVYVEENHAPIAITKRGKTTVYPQSQTYKVTIEAEGYEQVTGSVTYYTGTSSTFSIIEEVDGVQTVLKTWSAKEIEALSSFANGSSQCGMTGFRSFSGDGVSLTDLLEDAGITVTDDDYFLLDTSDHYGNKFTYDELFGTTRYFLESIYDEGFADTYNEIVSSDETAGATIALRRYLAEQCLEDNSVVEPRINIRYDEQLISGSQLGGILLPTEDNTKYNALYCYENQYRFFYGISLVQEDCVVTFDTQGGSEVESQTVLSHLMTSTENTTIKSSYWANSLVIYRGQGQAYKTQASTAADTITVPEEPTREGYTFAGWYTTPECTKGTEFDFTANDGTVDQNTTLYAKWVEKDIEAVDYFFRNIEHKDEDGELNQTIEFVIEFNQKISLTQEDLSSDFLMTIADTDVRETKRDITYEVSKENPNQLIIRMVSNDWVAIYGGMFKITESEAGITHIVAADGSAREVVFKTFEGRIPTGIAVSNDTRVGTKKVSAATQVEVTHKANMRGMYSFELVSIVNGVETVVGTATSHAHNFYTTIDEAAIASAMATAIGKMEGYTTEYTDGAVTFVVTADTAVEGQKLVVRMVEHGATNKTYHSDIQSPVEENRVEATASKNGSYEEVVYCGFCHEELSRTKYTLVYKQPESTVVTEVNGTRVDGGFTLAAVDPTVWNEAQDQLTQKKDDWAKLINDERLTAAINEDSQTIFSVIHAIVDVDIADATPDEDGYYTVTLYNDKIIEGAMILVMHYDGNEWIPIVPEEVGDGWVRFKTKGFSPFAIAEVGDTTAQDKENTESDGVQTGDTTSVVTYFIVFLCAAVFLIAATWKKFRKEC